MFGGGVVVVGEVLFEFVCELFLVYLFVWGFYFELWFVVVELVNDVGVVGVVDFVWFYVGFCEMSFC